MALLDCPGPGDVAHHLGAGGPGDDRDYDSALRWAVRVLNGYTRGIGFMAVTDTASGPIGLIPADLWAVVVSVAARAVANPTARRAETFDAGGDFTQGTTWATPAGFTLPELAVLNRYRRRTA